MKRLDKHQTAERNRLVADLTIKAADVSGAWAKFVEAHEALAATIVTYNEAVSDAASWRDEIVGDMTNYQSERSEKWQEGDAGQAYQAWIDEWESGDLEEIAVPELPDEPEFPQADTLDALPEIAEAA